MERDARYMVSVTEIDHEKEAIDMVCDVASTKSNL